MEPRKSEAIDLRPSNPKSKKLSEEQGQLIHHVVKKPRYLRRCTKQDIQTVVGFLCIE